MCFLILVIKQIKFTLLYSKIMNSIHMCVCVCYLHLHVCSSKFSACIQNLLYPVF